MERYNEYKDSGVQWLGEIPSHWEVVPFKNIANIILGKMLENAPEGQGDKYLCAKDVHMNSMNYDDLKLMKFSPEEKKKYAIQKGDMLVVEGGASGSSAIVNKDVKNVYIQNSLMIVRCGENVAYNPFASYMLNSMVNRGYAESVCNKATIMHFTKEKLGATLIACPPLPEQQAIASYLDTVTSKIDIAISQQQKMIDLLNERKQIIINNAVTKGLNPNVKMKDSGVDWIGEIPEHWEVTKLKSIGTTINGVSHDSSYFGEGYPFVSYSDVYKNSILPLKVNGLAKSSTLEQKIFSVEEGDVFFTRTSETAEEIGITSTCVKTIPQAVFAGFLIRFRPRKGILDSKFSSFYFRAQIHRSYFVKEMNLVIRASLSQQLLKGLPVLLPHIQEQREIADYLNAEIGKIEQAINTYTKQISLLQERKQVIINEVVTGKVKVTK